MKWWLSRRVDEHFIFLSLSLLKKKSKKYFSLKYKYCLLSFCAQILYFVYIYILQLTIETNSPPRNLPFLLLMRSFPRSPPMRSTMAQSLTTLGDGTDWYILGKLVIDCNLAGSFWLLGNPSHLLRVFVLGIYKNRESSETSKDEFFYASYIFPMFLT